MNVNNIKNLVLPGIIMVIIIVSFLFSQYESTADSLTTNEQSNIIKSSSNQSEYSVNTKNITSNSDKYSNRIGSTGDANNEKSPTQTAWVDPNGDYFMGDGPFDITDKNGVHHLIDPIKSGWTRTTYDDIKASYSALESSNDK